MNEHETEQTLQEMVEDLRGMKELVESRGWTALMRIAEAQLEARRRRVLLTPVGKEYSVTEEQYDKGEIAGVMLFQAMPETAIEGLELDIEELRAKLQQQDEDE